MFEVRIDEDDPGTVYVVEEGADLDTQWAINFDIYELGGIKEKRVQGLAQFCANVMNMDLRKMGDLND